MALKVNPIGVQTLVFNPIEKLEQKHFKGVFLLMYPICYFLKENQPKALI